MFGSPHTFHVGSWLAVSFFVFFFGGGGGGGGVRV